MTALFKWVLPGYSATLALAVTAPLLGSGYLLIRDAVSTPRSYLSDGAIGLGESAPRAVPQDFAIASLSAVLDGGFVVKALLIAGLFLAGWGAGRLAGALLPESGTPGQLAAATVAVWNPFVAERLLQGHWSLLLAYGCLPWVAVAVVGLRSGEAGAGDWVALVFWTTVAGLTPTGVLLAVVVGMTCVAVPGAGVARARCLAGVGLSAVLAAAPWLTASLLGSGLRSATADGLAVFAPRGEPLLGTLGSLAGLGGIWNAEAVPHSRTSGWALAGTVLLLAVVACGVPAVLRRRTGEPLLALAAAAVLLPAAMATGPGLALLRAAVEAIPGLAVLRDGQKWVALAMPGYAVAAAGSVVFLQRWMRPAVAGGLCCLALVAALPDLAWGAWGRVSPVRYPPGWAAVAAAVNADPRPVLALPAETMRQFDWAGAAPVLDPLPRWVRAEVLNTGDLRVGGETLAGEGRHARAVQELLLAEADPATLREAGVGWVVVEGGTPGRMGGSAHTLNQLPVVYRDDDMTLYRVGGVGHSAPPAARRAVMAAHLLWAGMLLGSAVLLLWRFAKRAAARSRRGPRVRLRRS